MPLQYHLRIITTFHASLIYFSHAKLLLLLAKLGPEPRNVDDKALVPALSYPLKLVPRFHIEHDLPAVYRGHFCLQEHMGAHWRYSKVPDVDYGADRVPFCLGDY